MITINEVSKRYHDQLAVDRISLTIKRGEIFGLLGPNGAGKTSLVNMMSGVVAIDGGTIEIDGYNIKTSPLEAKRKIGVVPQEIALFDGMTVVQNLSYFGALYGLKGNGLKQGIKEALEMSQLEEKSKKKVKTLSGGMKRRLNIVCAMMHKPNILILDEPTVGIDPQSRNHIMEVVKMLNTKHQMTIIYITHYMEEVEKLCHRVGIIDKGQLIMDGTIPAIVNSLTDECIVDVMCDRPSEQQLYLLDSSTGIKWVKRSEIGIQIALHKGYDHLSPVVELLSQAALKVTSLSFIKPSLEHAFLKLTGHALRDA